jgi:hypothetical protein
MFKQHYIFTWEDYQKGGPIVLSSGTSALVTVDNRPEFRQVNLMPQVYIYLFHIVLSFLTLSTVLWDTLPTELSPVYSLNPTTVLLS